MAKLTKKRDAYGQAMWDYLHGKGSGEIAELDSGHITASGGPQMYFAEYKDWPAHQKKAIRLARGRALDVGCGAGRVALHLQGKGLDVLAIDTSPLAIKVAKARGVKKARLMSITQLTRKVGLFDTIVMYGNNFGLLGGPSRAKWLLRRFHAMTSPDARIIAESNDPYQTDNPCHLAYQKRNRRRGRMGGQLRLRIRYQDRATPWFDYLLVSPDEMRDILAPAGWHVARIFPSKASMYAAVIEKEH
jgi:SAM-dependent methyltransferase